jgi:ABC-type multidrug transport system fused ATPase/permease subunit
MVIVTHRLSSLVDCDQILVLDKGMVIDVGPHAELLEKCAIYRTLWNQQHRHMFKEGSGHAAFAPALLQGN